MANRRQNEKRFGAWEDLAGGGRRYWIDRSGHAFGFQRMVKIVDAEENTVSVVQEIYNDEGVLIERHVKFPEDLGHQRL
jgi:hypothetical protein